MALIFTEILPVKQKFLPGRLFTLGKDPHIRKVISSNSDKHGWIKIEVLLEGVWVPGDVSHFTLASYLQKKENGVQFLN